MGLNARLPLCLQEEYIKGVSAWDFDVAKLKQQAAMEPDEDGDAWNFDPPVKEEAPAAAEAPEGLRRNPSVEVPKDSASPSAALSPSPKDGTNLTPGAASKGAREAQQMVCAGARSRLRAAPHVITSPASPRGSP